MKTWNDLNFPLHIFRYVSAKNMLVCPLVNFVNFCKRTKKDEKGYIKGTKLAGDSKHTNFLLEFVQPQLCNNSGETEEIQILLKIDTYVHFFIPPRLQWSRDEWSSWTWASAPPWVCKLPRCVGCPQTSCLGCPEHICPHWAPSQPRKGHVSSALKFGQDW